ncbi:MAG TPA: metal ABC transporter ATP-binding protein [Candidatus Megaira endosymbiont of Hartmannula sinica]|nr:metal ABC transporter ATP-binding protein [Candidatus Megaera endosymbiont of Hartmannula sinica]
MNDNILEVKNITKYFNKKLVVDDVSFKLKKSTLTTLIGQNGAGKTTLAKILIGLASPTSGNIKINDNIKIGYVPQKLIMNRNIPLSVADFFALNTDININAFKNDSSIQDIVKFSRVENHEHTDISKISGGERQRLTIVSTIINKPDLLIMDEPTYWLDLSGQKDFYDILDKYRRKYNITILMISHDLFTVFKKSDRIICINKHICCEGTPEKLTSCSDSQAILSQLGIYNHRHDHHH